MPCVRAQPFRKWRPFLVHFDTISAGVRTFSLKKIPSYIICTRNKENLHSSVNISSSLFSNVDIFSKKNCAFVLFHSFGPRSAGPRHRYRIEYFNSISMVRELRPVHTRCDCVHAPDNSNVGFNVHTLSKFKIDTH